MSLTEVLVALTISLGFVCIVPPVVGRIAAYNHATVAQYQTLSTLANAESRLEAGFETEDIEQYVSHTLPGESVDYTLERDGMYCVNVTLTKTGTRREYYLCQGP